MFSLLAPSTRECSRTALFLLFAFIYFLLVYFLLANFLLSVPRAYVLRTLLKNAYRTSCQTITYVT